ncbi:MAG: TetM/TetW/TetO/TetS family tetracycline resistance ribosomal protection protein [Clostridia bacterium]|nr:TetM/TetW/TetO/TetS family tetracycline resistance ribosomal protection protein [Clostridia bacterium]
MQMQKRKLVMGLLAHVDAGKTTLSEAMLFTAGNLRKLGRVDHGDAFLDTDVQERERGITIFSKQAMFSWKQADITLLDTPGHVDFSSEMERTLPLLDCAVLVISGGDGVQGHTLTLWKLMEQYQVPTFLFINKMDQQGTDREALMADLKARLSDACVDFFDPEYQEQIAMCSEEALNHFLQYGEIPDGVVGRLIARRQLFPCFFGAALKNQGVDTLLDGLIRYTPQMKWPQEFGARVYKIARDAQGARITYMKITGGQLKVRDLITNRRADTPEERVWAEKVSQIRLYSGAKFQAVDSAEAGMVCAVTGLSYTRPGDGLGLEKEGKVPLLSPVFTYQVMLPPGMDAHAALRNLRILEEEDPQLHVVWHERVREIHVQLMGEVQLEILKRLLYDRFQMNVIFSEGSILYRETIENAVEGAGHYEPLRHYAEVHLLLEPGRPGSGMRFATACSQDDLDVNWQRLILTHLQERQHYGVLTGSPITDMKITLLAGRAHLKHTEGGDFRQATYRAVRQGLMQAKSILLEPWYDLHLEIPRECLGRAMNDIQQMGGSFSDPKDQMDLMILDASAPVSQCRHYAREVASYSRGRGKITCTLKGYAPCRDQERVVERMGYDPERDTDNPADSVFCSHGAGFVVKWDEAMDHMHIQTGYFDRRAEQAAAAAAPRPRSAYTGSLEEDKELMAIFERTYGPVKRDTFRSAARPSVSSGPVAVKDAGKEFLLVDGYNIIFSWEELKAAARINLDQARLALCDLLCNYRGMKNCEVILVFDAYKVAGNAGAVEKYNNIYVVYTREAETADSYIEKTSYEISKKYHVRVATSDGMEQMIILGHGALRVSAQEFRREVEAAQGEIAAFLAQNNRHAPSDAMGDAIRDAWRKKHGVETKK